MLRAQQASRIDPHRSAHGRCVRCPKYRCRPVKCGSPLTRHAPRATHAAWDQGSQVSGRSRLGQQRAARNVAAGLSRGGLKAYLLIRTPHPLCVIPLLEHTVIFRPSRRCLAAVAVVNKQPATVSSLVAETRHPSQNSGISNCYRDETSLPRYPFRALRAAIEFSRRRSDQV